LSIFTVKLEHIFLQAVGPVPPPTKRVGVNKGNVGTGKKIWLGI